MDIGVSTAISSDSVDVAVLAKKAESLGFESFWLPEHTIVPVHTNTKCAGTADGSIPPSMADMGDPLIGLARASDWPGLRRSPRRSSWAPQSAWCRSTIP